MKGFYRFYFTPDTNVLSKDSKDDLSIHRHANHHGLKYCNIE